MNKKSIAYILIGVGVLGAIIYLITKKSSAGSSAATAADSRGAMASDDDATYAKMKALLPTGDQGWVGDLAKTNYTSGQDQNGATLELVNGVATKSAAFSSVFFESNKNPAGKYTYPGCATCQPTKMLWPQATQTAMWNLYTAFKARNNSL